MPRLRAIPRAVLALCLSAPVVHAAAAALAPQDVFERSRAAVAVVEVRAGETSLWGSAVALGAGRFATACSLLDGGDGIRVGVGGASGDPAAATVIARDPARNLCLLSAPAAQAAVPLAPAAEPPRTGARVYAVSNALNLGLGITEGVLSAVRRRAGAPLLQFSAPVSPGSDGGALVDEQGRLIGVIDYQPREGQNVNFAVAAAALDEIEARNERDARRQSLRDQAPRLRRAGDAEGLAALAGEWTRLYPDDAEGWRWGALAAGLRGDPAAEEAAWRGVARLDPGSLEAGLGLGWVLLRQQRHEAARELAQALLAAHRDSPGAWSLLGTAQLGLGAPEAAEEALRGALELDPWELAAHDGLIALARGRGDHARVAATWAALVRRYPEEPALRWRLLQAQLDAGDAAGAWTTLERLPDGLATGADGLFWRGVVLGALRRPQEAIATLRRSLELGPSQPARAWTELGRLCHGLHRFPEAIAAHREAVRLAPDAAHHRFWLAVALKDGGYVEEALEIDRRLVAEWAEDAAAWRQLGMAAAAATRTQDSIAALERSLALEPRAARLWGLLIQQYHAAGRRDAVLRAYGHLRGLDAAAAERAYRASIAPFQDERGAAPPGPAGAAREGAPR